VEAANGDAAAAREAALNELGEFVLPELPAGAWLSCARTSARFPSTCKRIFQTVEHSVVNRSPTSKELP
jgi:hypothetical protein